MAVHRRVGLAARYRSLGYTQEEFAVACGVDRRTAGRWVAGTHAPQPWLRGRIAAVLKVQLPQLEALLFPARPDPTPAVAAGSLTSGQQEEIDEVLRRRFMALTTSALASLQIPDPGDLIRPGSPGRMIGGSDVAAVRQMTVILGDAASEVGGGRLLAPALQYLNGAVDPMLAGHADASARDLRAEGSAISQLTAWMAQDAGDFDTAADLYWKARDLGEQARDPELEATALRGLSTVAGERREFGESVRLAEMAVEAAGSLDNPKARAYYLCSLATAASLDGDRSLALASLESSRAHIERAESEPGYSWASHYSPGRWAHEAGLVLARAGELGAAADHMRQSLDTYGLDRRRTRAIVLADLGVVRLKQGDADEAMNTFEEFLRCAAGLSSSRIDIAVKDMASRLSRVGGSDAARLRVTALTLGGTPE